MVPTVCWLRTYLGPAGSKNDGKPDDSCYLVVINAPPRSSSILNRSEYTTLASDHRERMEWFNCCYRCARRKCILYVLPLSCCSCETIAIHESSWFRVSMTFITFSYGTYCSFRAGFRTPLFQVIYLQLMVTRGATCEYHVDP